MTVATVCTQVNNEQLLAMMTAYGMLGAAASSESDRKFFSLTYQALVELFHLRSKGD